MTEAFICVIRLIHLIRDSDNPLPLSPLATTLPRLPVFPSSRFLPFLPSNLPSFSSSPLSPLTTNHCFSPMFAKISND